MWKNTVQSGRPQITVQRIRNAWWMPKAIHTHTQTHTHTEYVLLFHCKNGSTNAPQCYVIGAWPVLSGVYRIRNSLIYKNRKFIFLRQPDDGREHDRNMLVNSNMEYTYILTNCIRQCSTHTTI